jgi:hypothetical protein
VFHATLYGAVVSGEPITLPSTRNVTEATPTLSDAFADTVTVPDTVAPLAGEVMFAVGGVVSDGDDTVTVRAADVVVAPD